MAGFSVTTYGAGNKKLKLASLGLKSITADNDNHKVVMELADGSKQELVFDVLKELSDVEQIDDSNEIKFIFSDGSKSEPIKVPTVKSIRRYKTTAEAEADIESIIADDIEQVIIEDEDADALDTDAKITLLESKIADLTARVTALEG